MAQLSGTGYYYDVSHLEKLHGSNQTLVSILFLTIHNWTYNKIYYNRVNYTFQDPANQND